MLSFAIEKDGCSCSVQRIKNQNLVNMRNFFLVSFMAMGLLTAFFSCKSASDTTKSQVESAAKSTASTSKKDVLLVKYHADWCGSCKTLTPMLKDLNRKLKGKNTTYVELNLTDENTTSNAKATAAKLGLAPLDAKQKTGFVAIIDANSKKLLGKLTKTQSVEEMYQDVLNHL